MVVTSLGLFGVLVFHWKDLILKLELNAFFQVEKHPIKR